MESLSFNKLGFLCFVIKFLDFYAFDGRYNPYVQSRGRIDQLKRLGHSVDKVSKFAYSVD